MCDQRTKNLVECLTKKDKLELIELTSELMPNGNPDFRIIRHTQPIKSLIDSYGKRDVRFMIFEMVKDFCESFNVVRNMREDQMIESAAFLIDDCGDMRLEDFHMMFTLAKRGRLIKIMDRIDIDIIGKIYDAYYIMRSDAGRRIQEEEFEKYERYLRIRPPEGSKNDDDKENEMESRFGKLVGIMKAWNEEDEERKKAERIKKSEDSAENRRLAEEAKQKKIAEYAKLENVDFEKIREEFKGTRLEHPKK